MVGSDGHAGPSDPTPIVIPPSLQFPRTINKQRWIDYLGRPLTSKEQWILNDVKTQHSMNNHLQQLYKSLKDTSYTVPVLTNLEGDCLFESLVYHGVGDSVSHLRQGLAHLMYLFKDYTNFFPNIDMSLEQMFELFHETEYVQLLNSSSSSSSSDSDSDSSDNEQIRHRAPKKIYKYSYGIMCQDLTISQNWSKLPTEIILRFLSRLFDLDITVFHDNGYRTQINGYSECPEESVPELTPVYLAQLGESHYLPITSPINRAINSPITSPINSPITSPINSPITSPINRAINSPINSPNKLYYHDARHRFTQWGSKVERNKIVQYLKQNTDIQI